MKIFSDKYGFILAALISVSILFSCSDDTPEPSLHDSFLFQPLTPGTERIYQVTKIHIDAPTNIRDTSIFLLRERVLEPIFDTLNYMVYLVSQEVRYADSLPWQHYKQIAYRIHARKIVRIEDNVHVTVLEFPESVNRTWDGNEYNNNPQEMYTYSSLTDEYVFGDLQLDSVATISQKYFKSLYTYTFKQEQYAYGIGMCYKIDIDVESQPIHGSIDITLPIEQRVTYGFISEYSLVSYIIP